MEVEIPKRSKLKPGCMRAALTVEERKKHGGAENAWSIEKSAALGPNRRKRHVRAGELGIEGPEQVEIRAGLRKATVVNGAPVPCATTIKWSSPGEVATVQRGTGA